MYTRSQQIGFSLIELMISLTILAMLIGTATLSYQILMQRWQKGLQQFDRSYQQYHSNTLLQSVIRGIFPYVVVDTKGTPSFFFIGGEQSLLAVTRNGLFDDSSPEIFRLTLQSNGDGTFRLIYQSSPMDEVLLVGTDQEIEFVNTLVMHDGLSKLEFKYVGWHSLKDRASQPVPKKSTFQTYSGIDSQLMPQSIEVMLFSKLGSLTFSGVYDTDSFKELSAYFSEVQ